MTALLRSFTGLLLASMGGFMIALTRSDSYWQFLNPRYAWLTLVSGAIIVLLGLLHCFHKGRASRATEILALIVFLGLALSAARGPHLFAGPSAALTPAPTVSRYTGGGLTRGYNDDLTPDQGEVTLSGRQYTQINLAELIAIEETDLARPGSRFAVQGTLLRTPELDKSGHVALARLYVYCCFADAVGVVTLVRVDDPAAYRSGSWARVLGTLQPENVMPGRIINVAGALTSVRSDMFTLTAVRVDETPVAGVPFILDVRKTPPFDY